MEPRRLLPLQQLPDVAMRPLRGMLTDIDDTLTCEGAIEPVALQALQPMAAASLPVIAITGRPIGWSEPFALDWPVAAIVAENGAVVLIREGDALRTEYAQDAATREPTRVACTQWRSACCARCPAPRWRVTAPAG